MISKYSNFDSYLFLFSVDWMKPFIKQLLNVDSRESNLISEASKQAVKHMIGSASSYYEISFTEDRKLETERTFLNNLNNESAEKAFVNFVVELEQGFDESLNQQASIIWGILLQLESYEPLFGEKDYERFEHLIKSLDGKGDEFFEGLDESSNSEWDAYVRSLKPGTETHVSDFFLIHVYEKKIFNVFWAYVKVYLNENHRDKIKASLSDNYLMLTGASINSALFN